MKDLALAILNRAEQAGFYFMGEELLHAPELATAERETFIIMFRELARYLTERNRSELDTDEIDSLFNYVVGKSAEHAYNYFTHQKLSLDVEGMFTSRTPLYVDTGVMAFLKATPIAVELGGAFLDWQSEHPEADKLMTLFEALKWTARITTHLVLELLEEAEASNEEYAAPQSE